MPLASKITGLLPGEKLNLSGWVGSSPAFSIAKWYLATEKPALILTNHLKEAQTFHEDLKFYLQGHAPVTMFPSLDLRPYYHLSPNAEPIHTQIQILWQLKQAKEKGLWVVPLKALTQKLISPKLFDTVTQTIIRDQEIDLNKLINDLTHLGYERTPLVEDVGTFAVRGGTIDIFSPAHDHPCRIDLFGDMVEALRFFELQTQKSVASTEQIVLTPTKHLLWSFLKKNWKEEIKKRCDDGDIPKTERDTLYDQIENNIYFPGHETFLPFLEEKPGTLFDYLPNQTVLFGLETDSLLIQAEKNIEELKRHQKESTSIERMVNPEELFLSKKELESLLSFFPLTDFSSLQTGNSIAVSMETNEFIKNKIRSFTHEESLKPLANDLDEKRELGTKILITSHSKIQKDRIFDLLSRFKLPLMQSESRSQQQQTIDSLFSDNGQTSHIHLLSQSPSRGFFWPEKKLWVLTEEDLFGQKIKKKKERKLLETFSSFSELGMGDFIVHQDHGIGIYRGLIPLTINGIHNDFIFLEYQGGDKLYVPVDQLDRIGRYSAQEGIVPTLDKMGGTSWLKVREKIRRATRRLASQLLKIQAVRAAAKGFSFSPRNAVFEEFEATFPYEETQDQQQAINDVLADMESDKPTDRLVCGDVGYGKTEVAIRAAFKAVLDHKQVAVLVPTTVLAFQHYQNFKKRFESHAINLASLSRFQTASEQKKIVEKIKNHTVDIIVGTHRLLSNDIHFANLGLVIVDEEHRFGVTQKEKLKKFQNVVDIVTLTATPIPRTLNFALSGIRDLSIINTPPEDRLAVRTFVTEFDDASIREAIMHEMTRGGQVFFVHNRVQTIEGMRDRIAKLVPKVKIGVAHGQMLEEKLEEVMLKFMDKKFDVLLCTTIIESGIDIPLANTIIINRADHLGLAQLYQLRGRVGRSHQRAYCYLIVPHDELMTKDARKRLGVIQRFTELGSGFKIASHDLEIRGAGNILGDEQSGHIASIGYDLYVKLLEEAVMELKGEKTAEDIEVEMKLPLEAHIPESLIPDTSLRLVLYKQLSSLRKEEDCKSLHDEWTDRFGQLPGPTQNLIELIRLKIKARALGLSSVSTQKSGFVVQIHPHTSISADYLIHLVRTQPKKFKITPDGRLIIGEPLNSGEEILKKTDQMLSRLQNQQ